MGCRLLFSVTTGNAAYEAKANRPPKENAEAEAAA